MNDSRQPLRGPATPAATPDPVSTATVDGEAAPAPGADALLVTLESPTEALTEEDLRARATVGFALDLEPLLPGAPVGSEKVLLESDPAAARRLGLNPDAPWAPPAERSPWAPPPLPPLAPPPEPVSLVDTVDVEPVLSPPPDLLTPDVPPPPAVAASPPPEPPPPPPRVEVPVPAAGATAFPPLPARVPVTEKRPRPALRTGTQRRYPLAFAWAGLGDSPWFGPRAAPRPATTPLPEPAEGSPLADDLLELAAMGQDDNGVMEMHLVFKEDVLRGLVCRLRVEPEGLYARFLAPDETVRRYLEGTAGDLIERMRRRGMRIGGWAIEVSG